MSYIFYSNFISVYIWNSALGVKRIVGMFYYGMCG